MGRDSSVGIATRYELDGPGIESRWGARFSAPVQTGPRAHPASCTMGTGSFPGVRCGRGVALTAHPHLAPRLKKKSRAVLLLPLWTFVACSRVNFTFTFTQVRYLPTPVFFNFQVTSIPYRSVSPLVMLQLQWEADVFSFGEELPRDVWITNLTPCLHHCRAGPNFESL